MTDTFEILNLGVIDIGLRKREWVSITRTWGAVSKRNSVVLLSSRKNPEVTQVCIVKPDKVTLHRIVLVPVLKATFNELRIHLLEVANYSQAVVEIPRYLTLIKDAITRQDQVSRVLNDGVLPWQPEQQ